MTSAPNKSGVPQDAPAASTVRGRLFRKYAAMFVAVVCSALAANGALEIWFSYQEQKSLLIRIQHEQAMAAAARIGQFVKGIESQMAWATQLSWDIGNFDDWHFEAVRMLREVPAITEIAQLDRSGRELYRVSRQGADVVGSRADHSHDAFFVQAMANKVYYGSVYFVGGSEPHMALAMAGPRRDGVIEVQVDLRFIWDVVSRIKAGERGYAYVIDASGRLLAHPDISLVLRQTDMSDLPQVQASRIENAGDFTDYSLLPIEAKREVVSANATVTPLNWRVFVDLPAGEAFAPIYNSIFRSAALVLAALLLALLAGLVLARKMVVPIRALHDGAARVGSGDLTHRISIETGDELEALGNQFNNMAARLQDSYATLEAKVQERTRQLESANLAKSRFIAAASHDLRQPLHAIGLFVAQLHGRLRAGERQLLVGRIEAAIAAMNDLFGALLDISKLDAGGMTVNLTDFPVAKLLAHAENTFGEAARAKGLSLRVVPSGAWTRSDFILLERVVFNLISNAVRYTSRGGLVVGCRKRGDALRIEIWDTGIGIPADQHEKIFSEFYRLGEADRDGRAGLGLGLAIVERLCRLLGHHVDLRSTPGKGSVFAITVPLVPAHEKRSASPFATRNELDRSNGKLVLVIDDDSLALEGMAGILRSWGCRVITADTGQRALQALAGEDRPPDLIISDYHLSDGRTGMATIERLREALSAPIPAFLISGDIGSGPSQEANAKGCHLLHKPVDPMALRAMFNRATKRPQAAATSSAHGPGAARSEIMIPSAPPATSNRVH